MKLGPGLCGWHLFESSTHYIQWLNEEIEKEDERSVRNIANLKVIIKILTCTLEDWKLKLISCCSVQSKIYFLLLLIWILLLLQICYTCRPHREYIRLFDVTENTGVRRHVTGRKCVCCHGDLKDTIVHFGERGGMNSPYRWKEAVKAANNCDLILCLGSSLKVRFSRWEGCLSAHHECEQISWVQWKFWTFHNWQRTKYVFTSSIA